MELCNSGYQIQASSPNVSLVDYFIINNIKYDIDDDDDDDD